MMRITERVTLEKKIVEFVPARVADYVFVTDSGKRLNVYHSSFFIGTTIEILIYWGEHISNTNVVAVFNEDPLEKCQIYIGDYIDILKYVKDDIESMGWTNNG